MLETSSHPAHQAETQAQAKAAAEAGGRKRQVFQGNYNDDKGSAQQKIEKIFGGRIKGDDRVSSSRLLRGEDKMIAGVKVPSKPMEPDNCCMSGCINCVWELFNDDLKDWKAKQQQAAQNLKQRGGRWPENFHAPVDLLAPENLPKSLEGNTKAHETVKSGWEEVPVLIRVFAETERRLKEKNKQARA